MGCRLKANQPIYIYTHIYMYIYLYIYSRDEQLTLRFTLSLWVCVIYASDPNVMCICMYICSLVYGRRSQARIRIHVLLCYWLGWGAHWFIVVLQEKTKCVYHKQTTQLASPSANICIYIYVHSSSIGATTGAPLQQQYNIGIIGRDPKTSSSSSHVVAVVVGVANITVKRCVAADTYLFHETMTLSAVAAVVDRNSSRTWTSGRIVCLCMYAKLKRCYTYIYTQFQQDR